MGTVAGVSGMRTPAGWVVVLLEDGALLAIRLAADLGEVRDAVQAAEAVGIDLPLGHDDPDGGVRACDEAARAKLGRHADRVALVPPPAVLDADDLAAARTEAKARDWPLPSEALFRFRDRVRQVQRLDDDRVLEIAPEVTYHEMQAIVGSGGPLVHPPEDRQGRHERLELLYEADLRPARSLGGLGRASPVDVLEATAAAWSADRVAEGTAGCLPKDPPPDPRTGRPVAIRF